MGETFVAPLPGLPNDFSVIFSGRSFPVSKFKMSLFSQKFRALSSQSQSNSMEFNDKTTVSTFQQFLSAAQGEQFEITLENYSDLLKLAKNWDIGALSDQVQAFVEAAGIPASQKDEEEADDETFAILAKNLDKTIKVPSFSYLPISSIEAVFKHKDAVCNDQHSMFMFIRQMLELHGSAATSLAFSLDLTKLPASDLLCLLNHTQLDKKIIAPLLIPAAKFYVLATSKLADSVEAVESGISSLQNPDFALKKCVERIKSQQATIDECTEQTESLEKDIKEEFDEMKHQMSDIEKRIRASSKKQNQESGEALTAIKSIQEKLNSIMQSSKESKRSPVRRPSIEMEEEIVPVTESRLTPIPLGNDPLDGVILALIAANNCIKVTASTSDHNDPSLVTTRDGFDYWMSNNKAQQWIKFNFCGKQIQVTDYTIKTIKFGEDSCHIKSWVLEGSNDDIEYTTLDEQDCYDLNGSNKVMSYKISGDSGSFKWLQLRMTGPNCRGDFTMALNGIEFFGILIEC